MLRYHGAIPGSSMEVLSIFFFCFTISLHALLTHTAAVDIMAVNQTIKDGQTLVSQQETFELGFFSPGNTQNRYLGIWYKRLATGTVAWVANRETPIRNKSGELTLHPSGVLSLRDSAANRVVWSSNSWGTTTNPMARLLDNGNLMVFNSDDREENYIWQSFDHPGDSYLPGMKFGRNLERGVVTNFTSWKSVNDPSQGPFIVYMDFSGVPQIYQKNGDVILSRLGSWNGLAFTGSASYNTNPIYTYEYVSNERETYIKFEMINTSVPTKMTLTSAGNMDRLNWINHTQGWFLYSRPAVDDCVRYALCGAYGSCDIMQSPPCGCLRGFTPKRPDYWSISDWTSGCQREIPLDCGVREGFRKYSFMKLPDTQKSWFDRNLTLEQCEVKCRKECNCTAYSLLDIKYGVGCLLWYDELIDMRTFPKEGQDVYIRMAAAELEKDERVSRSKKEAKIIVIPIVVGITILIGLCILIIWKRKLKAHVADNNMLELPLFSLSSLLCATDNFSSKNKLGEGGFGPVYKGFLEDGCEIAVKRLSKCSSQGVEEFKNEVMFVSKLQHRNLVKILGCCVEAQEKLLVYEYMPNRGLDLFLFQESKRKILDWSQRHRIINGVARGLLYLHQDSRLRIIHRDLKAANILLDHDMNPKISDFGLARSFGGNEAGSNTKKLAGTYGYMSPEYAGNGIFSVKSDVFSFGVLVLEIVSGKKNRGFVHQDHYQNLLGYAWILYKQGETLELVDASLIESGNKFEVLRSIHVGLLCVQQNPGDRPDISTVVMMLSNDDRLPEPKQPGFYINHSPFGAQTSSNMKSQISNNDITHTVLEAR